MLPSPVRTAALWPSSWWLNTYEVADLRVGVDDDRRVARARSPSARRSRRAPSRGSGCGRRDVREIDAKLADPELVARWTCRDRRRRVGPVADPVAEAHVEPRERDHDGARDARRRSRRGRSPVATTIPRRAARPAGRDRHPATRTRNQPAPALGQVSARARTERIAPLRSRPRATTRAGMVAALRRGCPPRSRTLRPPWASPGLRRCRRGSRRRRAASGRRARAGRPRGRGRSNVRARLRRWRSARSGRGGCGLRAGMPRAPRALRSG